MLIGADGRQPARSQQCDPTDRVLAPPAPGCMIRRRSGPGEIVSPVWLRSACGVAATPAGSGSAAPRLTGTRQSCTERQRTGAGMGRSQVPSAGLVAAAAVALAATSCLSDEGGGGGGGGGGTTSGDKNVEIVFGFGGTSPRASSSPWRSSSSTSGIKIKFTEASQSFDTLIRTRVRANNLPDIALFPQPGILKDFVKQGKMTDLSTQLDVNKLQVRHGPGRAGRRRGGRQVLRRPGLDERQEPGLLPEAGLGGQGLHRSRRRSRSSPTSPTRSRPTAPPPWCMGMESSRRDRLGGHRLDRGQPARGGRPGDVRQVGQPRDPVQRPGGQEGRAGRSRASCWPTATCSAAASRP